MPLSIELRGTKLNQDQLTAIVPVMNERMNRRMSKKQFEEACVKAMADAGCPLASSPSEQDEDTGLTPR